VPQAYCELADRYHLGQDPFNLRNNIMAGPDYLREMLNRFGSPSLARFLAAYNACPRRYAQHRAGTWLLPEETMLYVAKITRSINGKSSRSDKIAETVIPMSKAPLFVSQYERRLFDGLKPQAQLAKRPLFARPNAGTLHSAGLFALLGTSRSLTNVHDSLNRTVAQQNAGLVAERKRRWTEGKIKAARCGSVG
jgi:hypothetical protein